jgi:hypothetical protein
MALFRSVDVRPTCKVYLLRIYTKIHRYQISTVTSVIVGRSFYHLYNDELIIHFFMRLFKTMHRSQLDTVVSTDRHYIACLVSFTSASMLTMVDCHTDPFSSKLYGISWSVGPQIVHFGLACPSRRKTAYQKMMMLRGQCMCPQSGLLHGVVSVCWRQPYL